MPARQSGGIRGEGPLRSESQGCKKHPGRFFKKDSGTRQAAGVRRSLCDASAPDACCGGLTRAVRAGGAPFQSRRSVGMLVRDPGFSVCEFRAVEPRSEDWSK